MPSDISSRYLLTIVLWGLVLVVLVRRAWGRAPIVGLSIAYWANLALIHLIGGLIQLLPWHLTPERPHTIRGFEITGYAMLGFLIGQMIYRPARQQAPATALPPSRIGNPSTPMLAFAAIVIGVACFFFIAQLLKFIPSLMAVISNGLNLAATGSCLLWCYYYRNKQWVLAGRSIVLLVALPILTVLLQGFLAFGFAAMLTALSFIAVYHRRRLMVMLGAPVFILVGLSLFTVYLDARDQLRGTIKAGKSIEDRTNVVSTALEDNWSWFDPTDNRHLRSIELRLNQNILVGAASNRIDNGFVASANGDTLIDAVLAWIPRAIWQDKPEYAGSGSMVSRYTGIVFAEGTAVGIGHVMELFVNFGRYGVLVGYVLIGFVLAFLDYNAGARLAKGDLYGFVLVHLAGQTLLAVGGNFAEILPGMIGAVILGIGVTRLHERIREVAPSRAKARN